MKNIVLLIFLSVFVCTYCSSAIAFEKEAKFTVYVVDDNGSHVANANVGVGFERNFNPRDSIGYQQESDSNGKATFSESTSGYVTYGAKKEGYYNSFYSYTFTKANTFRWMPWDPELKVVLRKIENPVPMFARVAKIEIPVVNKDVGFDLIKYDWVAPYGKGKNSDFIFNIKGNVVDRNEFDSTLTIKFSNKYDGIQKYIENLRYGSRLKLPKKAPENNYKKILILHEWKVRGESIIHRNFNFLADDLNYIFRIRSTGGNKKEKKIRSMYGKIIGGIRFSAIFSKTGTILFKYYLNPDYTRNLEFDPKHNLFEHLSDFEEVTEP